MKGLVRRFYPGSIKDKDDSNSRQAQAKPDAWPPAASVSNGYQQSDSASTATTSPNTRRRSLGFSRRRHQNSISTDTAYVQRPDTQGQEAHQLHHPQAQAVRRLSLEDSPSPGSRPSGGSMETDDLFDSPVGSSEPRFIPAEASNLELLRCRQRESLYDLSDQVILPAFVLSSAKFSPYALSFNVLLVHTCICTYAYEISMFYKPSIALRSARYLPVHFTNVLRPFSG